jgi:Winged helix-turn-helix
MTLYRDRFDIITSILETAKTPARHTDILRTASLSHIPFKQYLLLLHANGLRAYAFDFISFMISLNFSLMLNLCIFLDDFLL